MNDPDEVCFPDHSLPSSGSFTIFVRVVYCLRPGRLPSSSGFFSTFFPGIGTGDSEGSLSFIGALPSYQFLRLCILLLPYPPLRSFFNGVSTTRSSRNQKEINHEGHERHEEKNIKKVERIIFICKPSIQ